MAKLEIKQEGGEASSIKEAIDNVTSAYRIIELNARPPIASVLTGVSEKVARAIYIEVQGKTPPRGKFPSKAEYYTSGFNTNLQATWFLLAYKTLLKGGVSEASALEMTYRLYMERFPDETARKLSFDRAYYLVRIARGPMHLVEVQTIKCGACGSAYLLGRNEIQNDENCPSCRLTAHFTLDAQRKALHDKMACTGEGACEGMAKKKKSA